MIHRILTYLVLLGLLAASANAQSAEDAPARFRPIDVVIDPQGAALAAYQIEVVVHGDGKIVGVEGGEHAAFNKAPYYDPAALQGGRIIIAAFSTGADLPEQSTRVASLHVRESGPQASYEVRLMSAATSSGEPIDVEVSLNQEESR